MTIFNKLFSKKRKAKSKANKIVGPILPTLTFVIKDQRGNVMLRQDFPGYFPGTFSVSGTVERTGTATSMEILHHGKRILRTLITEKKLKGKYGLLLNSKSLIAGGSVTIPAMTFTMPTI